MLATLPLLIALAIIVTGVVLVIRGVIVMRRSARLARVDQLGQLGAGGQPGPADQLAQPGRQTTGVVMIVGGAVLIGTVLALLVFTLMAVGTIADN